MQFSLISNQTNSIMTQYFIGLGSNIEPEKNIVKMIEGLFQWSERVDVSEIFRFAPHKMESEQYFLNTVVRIETSLSPKKLKSELVKLEGQLGRDRTDPDKKIKDRTADLDIVSHLELHQRQLNLMDLEEEEYVLYPLQSLLEFLNFETGSILKSKSFPKTALYFGATQIGEKVLSLYR